MLDIFKFTRIQKGGNDEWEAENLGPGTSSLPARGKFCSISIFADHRGSGNTGNNVPNKDTEKIKIDRQKAGKKERKMYIIWNY